MVLWKYGISWTAVFRFIDPDIFLKRRQVGFFVNVPSAMVEQASWTWRVSWDSCWDLWWPRVMASTMAWNCLEPSFWSWVQGFVVPAIILFPIDKQVALDRWSDLYLPVIRNYLHVLWYAWCYIPVPSCVQIWHCGYDTDDLRIFSFLNNEVMYDRLA